MKKLTILMVLVAAMALVVTPAVATTVTNPAINVSASVDGTLSLAVHLFKGSTAGPTGSELSSISFGTLKEYTQTIAGVSSTTLRSSDTGGMGEVIALISANSHQLPYTISQTGTQLTAGSNQIPTGPCVVTPVYATQDNAGLAMPASAKLADGGTWVGSRTLYTSESGLAAQRQIQAHYSITDDNVNTKATGAVPANQAAGNYAATVTITVTA